MRIATLLGAGIALLLSGNTAFSQQLKLGLNPYTVQKSALLELNSTNQGLLLARITDTSLINSLSPPDGMVIFFTPTKQLMVRSNGFWQSFTTSTGITSLNGLTALAQTFATGTAGTDFGISSAGSVHTFNLPDASATARGVVTTGTQTFAGSKTFSSVLNLTATNPLNLFGVQAGTATTADSLLTITSGLVRKIPMSTFAISTGITNLNGLTGATQTFATSATGTDFNISSSGTAHTFNIPSASATARGLVTTGTQTFAGAKTFTSSLNVTATNPLTLTGVQAGTSTTADSLLTITSGLVRKIPMSTFAISTGITSLNGLTAATQTFVTGTTGTDFNISSTGSAHTFNFPDASATARGLVTTGAQTFAGAKTFTSALNVTATNPLTLTGVQAGTSTTADSLLTITSGLVRKIPMSTFAISTGITSLNGLTTATQTFATGTTGTDFNISSTGSAHTFNIPDASATARGLVTMGAQTFAGAKTFTSAPLFSSLTAGSIPYIGTGGLVSQANANLFWDAANNRMGIGTSTPATALHVAGTNPLTLTGVQAGTSTTADSLLTITSGLVRKIPMSTFASASNFWALGGNATGGLKNLGTTDNNAFAFITNGAERMRINNVGQVGIGVTDAGNPLVVKDTLEIRRTGALSQLLFSNTAGTGDFRIGSDGSDIFWQGGGARNLQMGAFWTVMLLGDRQSGGFPSYVNGTTGIGVLVQGQRDASVPLGIQANSATQSANLTEWRSNTGTALDVVDKSGNVGLGTTVPATKLHVMGTNPLTLSGVQLGTNTATDSVLTISGGLVKKLPASTFLTSSGFWALGGNVTGGLKSLGTTDINALPFITNSVERMRISSTGSVGIGTSTFDNTNPEKFIVDAGTTTSFNLIEGHGRINNYLQFNIQNDSAGTTSSSDLVATANNGSETNNFVDLGINSSAFTGTDIIGGANNAYLYSTGNNFVIGNAISGKALQFFTGGTATTNERLRIDGTGHVGIGTTSPTADLHLAAGTASANTAPLKMTTGTNLTTPEDGAVEYNGTNYFVTSGTTRYTLAKTLTATATSTFPTTGAGGSATMTITISGAADGDVVTLGIPAASGSQAGAVFTAYVSAANTVTIKLNNVNGLLGANVSPSGTFRVSVLKY